jgi:hypothetical protein
MWKVLHEGALLPRGMPRFTTLSQEQSGQIHAYIRAGARLELARQKGEKVPNEAVDSAGS